MPSRIVPSAVSAIAVATVCAGAAVAHNYSQPSPGDQQAQSYTQRPAAGHQSKSDSKPSAGDQQAQSYTQQSAAGQQSQSDNRPPARDQPSNAMSQSRLAYSAYLTGQAEVDEDGDDAGDPRAKGSASFLQANKTTLCYGFQLFGAGTPTAVHIHKGAEGENGPPVIAFDGLPKNGDGQPSGDPGASSGCKTLTTPEELKAARRIRKNPGNYYLNFHTQEFPEGAVRGQLSRLWYNAAN